MARTKSTARSAWPAGWPVAKSNAIQWPRPEATAPAMPVKYPETIGSLEVLDSSTLRSSDRVPSLARIAGAHADSAVITRFEAISQLPDSVLSQILLNLSYFTLLQLFATSYLSDTRFNLLVKSIKHHEDFYRRCFAQFPDLSCLKGNPLLIDVFNHIREFELVPWSTEELLWPMLAVPQNRKSESPSVIGTPGIVSSLADFQYNLDIFSCGALRGLDWSNVLVAGGAVLASLTERFPSDATRKKRRERFQDACYVASDIDLFIYGLQTDEECNAKLVQIFQAISSECSAVNVVAYRTEHAVTIVAAFPFRHIQVILRRYSSPAEILMGFDLDACAVGYDGTRVLALPRCHRAITRQYQIVDLSRRSPSYEYRLIKYAPRSNGFGIVIPQFCAAKLDPHIFRKKASQVTGLARLLHLHRMPAASPFGKQVVNEQQQPMSWLQLNFQRSYERTCTFDRTAAQEFSDAKLVSDYTTVFLPWGEHWTNNRMCRDLARKYLGVHFQRAFAFDESNRRRLTVSFSALEPLPPRVCFSENIQDVIVGSSKALRAQIASKCLESEQGEATAEAFVVQVPDLPPLSWLSHNPGAQFVGSFHPSDGDWTADAYLDSRLHDMLVACAQNDAETLKRMISEGVPVERTDPIGRRAIHIACEAGSLDCVHVLLALGVNVTVCVHGSSSTAMAMAARNGHHKVARALLEHQPSLLKDSLDILVSCACTYGWHELLQVVLDMGGQFADVSLSVRTKGAFLREAVQRNFLRCVTLLLQNGVTEQSDLSVPTASLVQTACGFGLVEMTTLLIDFGCSIEGRVPLKCALGSAVAFGSVPCVKLLLERGVRPDVGHGGTIPLHYAVTNAKRKLTELLLAYGANPNSIASSHNMTPIDSIDNAVAQIVHGSTARRAPDGCEDLLPPAPLRDVSLYYTLTHKEDPFAVGGSGVGSYEYDTEEDDRAPDKIPKRLQRFKRVRELVVAAGGKPSVASKYFFTNAAVVERYPIEFSQWYVEVLAACLLADVARVRELLEEKPSLPVNFARYGLSPLVCAAASGSVEITEMLLARNAVAMLNPVDVPLLPIHAAIRFGHEDVYKVLRDAGPSKVLTDMMNKHNVLFIAAAFHPGVLNSLIQGGVSTASVDRSYRATALHIACANRNHESVRLICAAGSPPLHNLTRARITAPEIAAYQGDVECVRILLQALQQARTAKVTASGWRPDEERQAAMLVAAEQDQELLRKSVSAAAAGGHQIVIREIFDSGMLLKREWAADEMSPVAAAASNGQLEMLQWLWDDPSTNVDTASVTAMQFCAARRQDGGYAGAKAILQANPGRNQADYVPAMHLAVANGNSKCFELLFEHGMSPLEMHQGTNPLFIAVAVDDINAVRCVMNSPLKSQALAFRDRDGNTIAHVAITNCALQCLCLLLDHGISLHVENNGGATAFNMATFHIARSYSANVDRHISLMKMLLCLRMYGFWQDGDTAPIMSAKNARKFPSQPAAPAATVHAPREPLLWDVLDDTDEALPDLSTLPAHRNPRLLPKNMAPVEYRVEVASLKL
eukprot:TRINITY_DN2842_c0_g1_i1.p1 TRINITY_DN2842_c0_g1~~TRINITY_DN2842_c0_g1_i1.p1  ORF type:complete len:1539 (-),score=330.01 TRINITY_DN2842_c0_g1_i1:264-4880(-)